MAHDAAIPRLEDLGPSPEDVRAIRVPQRVRARRDGDRVADTTDALVLRPPGEIPAYWLQPGDVTGLALEDQGEDETDPWYGELTALGPPGGPTLAWRQAQPGGRPRPRRPRPTRLGPHAVPVARGRADPRPRPGPPQGRRRPPLPPGGRRRGRRGRGRRHRGPDPPRGDGPPHPPLLLPHRRGPEPPRGRGPADPVPVQGRGPPLRRGRTRRSRGGRRVDVPGHRRWPARTSGAGSPSTTSGSGPSSTARTRPSPRRRGPNERMRVQSKPR
jgi:hypothetical protein